jgi:alkane 1-monooxygenase
MLRFQILQLLYLGVVWYQFGTTGLISAVIIGLISILLLEAVNYVEHYGLLRKKDLHGNYERVQIYHSWNSDHVLGRIFLYELTRHSDHHYNSTRPYQILRHHDQSPQLPLGYPGSIVLALVPPWWFKVMNHRIPK